MNSLAQTCLDYPKHKTRWKECVKIALLGAEHSSRTVCLECFQSKFCIDFAEKNVHETW